MTARRERPQREGEETPPDELGGATGPATSPGAVRRLARRSLWPLRAVDPRWALLRLRGGPEAVEDRKSWDEYYEEEDPYGLDSEGERARYEQIVAMLGPRRYASGLELGCAEGVLSELLAQRCDRLLAGDISERAVERARRRLSAYPHVEVVRLALPDDIPSGPFDFIVAPDALYYVDRTRILESIDRIEAALAPGGRLVLSHWRPFTPTHHMSGDGVARLLNRRTGLRRTFRRVEAQHRFDCFEKV